MRIAVLIAVVCLTVLACINAQVTRIGAPVMYNPVMEDSVEVYLAEADIPCKFEKIAVIHAQGEGTWTNEDQMIRKAKKEAGKIGANAILITQVNEPSAGAKVAGAIFGVGTTRRGQIVALRLFRD